MELPHWDPPCTGHFESLYDYVIYCTGWKYIDPDIFSEDCLPGQYYCDMVSLRIYDLTGNIAD